MKKDILEKAIVLMATAHSGQFDKGGNLYQLHPLQVMNLLKTDDVELMCIALLHDVVEDTKTTYHDMVELGFTQRIIDGVRCLTKERGQTYEEYCERLFTNIDAMKVKMADLTHNSDIRRLKGIQQKDIDRMAGYQRLYYILNMKVMEYEQTQKNPN